MSVFLDYIKGSISELRQVTWPTRQAVLQYTAIIVVSIIIAMLIVSVIDYGLSYVVDRFLIK